MRRRLDVGAVALATSFGAALRACGIQGIPQRGRCACPFHGGSNPTALCVTERRAHCFGCGWRGDAIDAVRQLLDLDFKAAVNFCAELAGIDPQRPRPSQIRRAIREREEAQRDEAEARRAAAEQFNALADRVAEIDRDCRIVERRWSLDPGAEMAGTRAWLDDLAELYARREQAEAQLEEWWQRKYETAA